MDSEKEIQLRNFYKEIPEQQLLDLLSEGENAFEEGTYALLVEEAKQRGLEDKLNEIKIHKEQELAEEKKIAEERKADYKFLKVFTTPMPGELAIIRSILDGENIPYFIKGENFGTLYGTADGLSSVDIMVREDYAQAAQDLLKDFISPSPSQEEEQPLHNEVQGPIISGTPLFVKISILSVLIVLFGIVGFIRNRNDTARTAFDKGHWYAKDGKNDEAIAEFNKAIRIKRNFAEAYMERGTVYQKKGNFDQAVLDFSQVIKIFPRYARAYVWRGYVYSRKEKYDQSIAEYNKAIELDPTDANVYLYRGLAYGKKGIYDQAVSDCIRAIDLEPNSGVAYSNRGIFYFLKGNHIQAISDCTKALELDPQDASAYFHRGLAYYRAEQYDKSIIDFTEAIKLKSIKEPYKKFIKYIPEKNPTDTENIREKILELLKGIEGG